jgi:hypothetical protein
LARHYFGEGQAIQNRPDNVAFRPWYGANDSGVQTIHVNRCGLCEGDPLMKLMYEDCGLQLVARVTNREIRKTISQLR